MKADPIQEIFDEEMLLGSFTYCKLERTISQNYS